MVRPKDAFAAGEVGTRRSLVLVGMDAIGDTANYMGCGF